MADPFANVAKFESSGDEYSDGDDDEYVSLVGHPDYEIRSSYPYTIRHVNSKLVANEWTSKTKGYVNVDLNGKPCRKHRLIALQFIPNPDNLSEVDHINHNRADYHIDNLRWVSSSNNQRNKSIHRGVRYNYIDKLPDDYIDVDTYETRNGLREFDNKEYYYSSSTDLFYYYNGRQYRILHINHGYNDALCVSMTDKNKRLVKVYYTKFKLQYDLL